MERKGLVKLASKKSVSQRLNRNVPKRARGGVLIEMGTTHKSLNLQPDALLNILSVMWRTTWLTQRPCPSV